MNIVSHAGGLILSVVALILLLLKSSTQGGVVQVLSFGVFGVSLVMLYAASTAYHSTSDPVLRRRFRVVDHAAIYILIAGTYTPFCLITLRGPVGWTIFALSWGMALTGVLLKLYFTGRFDKISTAMYVFMGWIIVFALKPLVIALSPEGLFWLVAGGVSYTLGAILFSIGRLPFNHALFHIFVLMGSACHFVAVYRYVI